MAIMLDQANTATHQMYNPVPMNPQYTAVVVPSREHGDDSELKMDRRRQQLAECSKRNRLKKKAELETLQSKLATLTSALSQETDKLRKELLEKDAELTMLKSELAIEKICHSETKSSDDSTHPHSFGATESSSSVLGKRSREEVLTEELKKRDKFIGALMQLANAMPVNPFKQMDLDIIPAESHLGDSPNPFLRDQFFKVLSGKSVPQVPDTNEDCSSILPINPIQVQPPVRQQSTSHTELSNHDAEELSDVLLELESGMSDENVSDA